MSTPLTPPPTPAARPAFTRPVLDVVGDANTLALPAEVNGQLRVQVRGQRNRIVVADTPRTVNLRINVRGDDCSIVVGERCVLIGDLQCLASGAHIEVGALTTMLGIRLLLHEAGRVQVGRDCMVSSDVTVHNSDVHSIVDVATGLRINPPADVRIGDHVWIAQGTLILKGAQIGSDSIVGAHSVVTGTVPSGCVVGGQPARVLRTGVTWDRRLLPWPGDTAAP